MVTLAEAPRPPTQFLHHNSPRSFLLPLLPVSPCASVVLGLCFRFYTGTDVDAWDWGYAGNWGLHDGPQLFNQPPANVTIPGQEGPMSAYVPELTNITTRLQAYAKDTGAKLLFAITSPMLANVQADNDVLELNRRAAAIMADAGVPTVNLHSAVVGKCGAAPQPTCFNHPDCFSPHCSAEGYAWLANSTIAPAIRSQLGV
eukprot:m.372093 g.372093  ORF g.372093 m.372093 type:complete len:201 (-) comp16686_c1_seq18:4568-5170(-)